MNTIWQSLLWKEWHEHKWKLAALTAIFLAFPVVMLVVKPEDFFDFHTGFLPFYVVLAGGFLGMSVAAGENGHGTTSFLRSLPGPMWQPALVKLLVAAVTAVVPLLLSAILLYVAAKFRPTFFEKIDVELLVLFEPACSALAVLSLLVWMAAIGANCRDEVRAGAVGTLVVLVVFGIVAGILDATQSNTVMEDEQLDTWFQAISATLPGGFSFLMVTEQRFTWNRPDALFTLNYPWIVFAFLCSHGALIGWYLRRYGRPKFAPTQKAGASLSAEKAGFWLGPPRRSQLSAIVWKQVRETGPLNAIAVIGIAGLALIIQAAHGTDGFQTAFAESLLGTGIAMGFFVTIVAGISVFYEDLQPGLHTFWRSRPVNIQIWFWGKFLTGLAVTALALCLPLVGALTIDGRPLYHPREIMMGLSVFMALYCWATATMCLIRQPIYAAVLTVGVYILVIVAINLFDHWGWSPDWGNVNVFTTFSGILALLGTMAAWWSVRNDVGWKG